MILWVKEEMRWLEELSHYLGWQTIELEELDSHNATEKFGDIWICIDPRHLNKVLKHERYPLSITEEVLLKLTHVKYIIKENVISAYWHIVRQGIQPFHYFPNRIQLVSMTYINYPLGSRYFRSVSWWFEWSSVHPKITMFFGLGDKLKQAAADNEKNLKAQQKRFHEEEMRLNRGKAQLKQSSISFIGYVIVYSQIQRKSQWCSG